MAQDRLSFQGFLKLAVENNLDLKIGTAKYEAIRSQSKAIHIPPPMVGYMKMTDQSGSSADGFEINQTIPFPTKLSKERSARKLMVQAEAENRQINENEIRAWAKVVYFNLWASQQKKVALLEKKGVLESHIRRAQAGVRSDSFLKIHQMKAETDLDLLQNEILVADQEILEKTTEAATFLNVDPQSFRPILEEIPLSPIPKESSISKAPQLEASRLTLESFRAQEGAARSSWFPDLYLRYRELGQTQLMPKTSELMVGISLPFIFPWDASSSSGLATAQRTQAQYEFEKEKRAVDTTRILLLAKIKSLRLQLMNIYDRLLPRAERRMKLIHNLSPRDMETLQDHRETLEAFPALKIMALELRGRYEAAVAEALKYEGRQE